ncbi:MAG: hypothetical protein K2N64_03655 [Anaeroplasmataceae bacterium]|nr:hypothetical protein [Anaeroplasmataceae bacterium]
MNSQDIINEYERRMRAMERELEEKRLKNLCRTENEELRRSLEESERFRRQESELLRLRILQEEVERRHRMLQEEQRRSNETYYPSYANQNFHQRDYEASSLKFLQEQIRQQELENERLKQQIKASNQQSYLGHNLQQYPGYAQSQTPNIYVTQNASMPNAQTKTLAPIEEIKERNHKLELPRREEKEASVPVFQSREIQQPFELNNVLTDVIKPARLTFIEAYMELNKSQKKYCDGLRAYAILKSGAKESLAKYHLSIGTSSKFVIKFMIKNGTVITLFRLEDERLRRLRKSANSDGAEIKVKETELAITDDISFQTAKEMIDLRLIQLEEDKEYQKIRASNRRKGIKETLLNTRTKEEMLSLDEEISRIEANLAGVRLSNKNPKIK